MKELKAGDIYKGFYVTNVVKDQLYKGHRRYCLRHRTTGLEIMYFTSKIPQNFICWTVRTPAFDNSGVFHILEHSVLNGSEKFPYGNGFNTISRRIVNSYMNAKTSPFCTMFMADSIIKSEALRLMDYLENSIFFPLLREECFLQEGWRIEYDENNNPYFNGTVLNEMKETFTTSARKNEKENFKYTNMIPAIGYYSGGDPLKIPHLTYERFIETHKKYYRPDNCLLQFWGKIPLEEMLDYISENYIPELEDKFNMHETLPFWKDEDPKIDEEMKQLLATLPPEEKSIQLKSYGPEKEMDNTFDYTYIWNLGEINAEKNLAANVFEEILEEKVKNAFTDIDYVISESEGRFDANNNLLFFLNISAVKPEHEKAVKERIELIKKDIFQNGVSEKILKRTKFFISLYRESDEESVSQKELKSFSERWASGKGLKNKTLYVVENEKDFKRAVNKKKFLNDLIGKYFTGKNAVQPHYVEFKYSYCSSEDYQAERNEKELILLQEICEEQGAEKIQENNRRLKNYQKEEAEKKQKECEEKFPIINLRDKEFPRYTANLKMEFLKNKVPCVESLSDREMNLNFVSFMFPIDNIAPERLKWLSIFERIYSVVLSENAYVMGKNIDLSFDVRCSEDSSESDKKRICERFNDVPFVNRNCISFTLRCLPDEIEKAFEIFRKNNFRKILNLDDLEIRKIKEMVPLKDEIIEKYQGQLIKQRLFFNKTQEGILNEMDNGYTAMKTMIDWNKNFSQEGFDQAQKIMDELLTAGCMVRIMGLKKNLKQLHKEINKTISEFNFQPLQESQIEKGAAKDLYLKKLEDQILDKESQLGEVIGKPQTIGECYVSIPLPAKVSSKEDMAQDILCTWIDANIATDKLRNEHGCYGVNVIHNSNGGLACFFTSQDPDPVQSVEIIKEIVREVRDRDWQEKDYEEICLSHFTRNAKYRNDLEQIQETSDAILFGCDYESYKLEEKNYYSVTTEDLRQAAQKLYDNLDKMKIDMVKVRK